MVWSQKQRFQKLKSRLLADAVTSTTWFAGDMVGGKLPLLPSKCSSESGECCISSPELFQCHTATAAEAGSNQISLKETFMTSPFNMILFVSSPVNRHVFNAPM